MQQWLEQDINEFAALQTKVIGLTSSHKKSLKFVWAKTVEKNENSDLSYPLWRS